jgi:hypothetical protein
VGECKRLMLLDTRRERTDVAAAEDRSGARHVENYLSDPAKLYRAPEADEAGDQGGPQADVFWLGAIAYHIFAGRPPADSPLELPARQGDCVVPLVTWRSSKKVLEIVQRDGLADRAKVMGARLAAGLWNCSCGDGCGAGVGLVGEHRVGGGVTWLRWSRRWAKRRGDVDGTGR